MAGNHYSKSSDNYSSSSENETDESSSELETAESDVSNEFEVFEIDALLKASKIKKQRRVLLETATAPLNGSDRTVVKSQLIEQIKHFDKWLIQTFVPAMNQLEQHPEDYIACFRRFKALTGKLWGITKRCSDVNKRHKRKQNNKKSNFDDTVSETSDILKKLGLEPGISNQNQIKTKQNNKTSNVNDTTGETSEYLRSLSLGPVLSYQNVLNQTEKNIGSPRNFMDALYPKSTMKLISDLQHGICNRSIQTISPNVFRCLLCKAQIQGHMNLTQHIKGKKHAEWLSDKKVIKYVASYHNFWRKQNSNEVEISQQMYFYPETEQMFTCEICDKDVHYQGVISHIKGKLHQHNCKKHKALLNASNDLSRTNSVSSLSSVGKNKNVVGKQFVQSPISNANKSKCINSTIVGANNTLFSKPGNSTNNQPVVNLAVNKFEHSPAGSPVSNIPAFKNGLCNVRISSLDREIPIKTEPMNSFASPILYDNEKGSRVLSLPNLNCEMANQTTSHNSSSSTQNDVKILNINKSDVKLLNDKAGSSTSVVISKSSSKEVSRKNSVYWENIPKRLQYNKRFVEIHESDIFCVVCNTRLALSHLNIMKHISDKSHIVSLRRTGKFKPPKIVYNCKVCNIFVHNENNWQQHLVDGKHKKWIIERNVQYPGEYDCSDCIGVFYGDLTSLPGHQHIKKKKKAEKLSESTIVFLLKDLDKLAEDLSSEAQAVMRYDNNEHCCRILESDIAKIFPNCKAYPFGSRISGTGCTDSDLDIFLDIGEMYDGDIKQDQRDQEKIIGQVSRCLLRRPEWKNDLDAISQARTPIIKAYHSGLEIDCDISFRHGLGVENTKLLRFYMNLQPIMRKLILLLKSWSYKHDFMTSYALSMLAIFYMQTKGYLVSVADLRKIYQGPPKMIAGWESTFCSDFTKVEVQPCTLTSTELLCDFFKYYANFKFETEVVCPLMGSTVQRELFSLNNGRFLPEEMRTYIRKINSDPESEVFRSFSPMCVQDPFDLSHNLTKAVPLNVTRKFKDYCDLSCNYLEQKK